MSWLRPPDLNSGSVRCGFLDREGSLWLGLAEGGGLARLRDGKVTVTGAREGLVPEVVWSVYEDRQRDLWLGTNDGLRRVRGGAIQSFGRMQGLSDERILGLFQDAAGALWVGTWAGGANKLDADGVTVLRRRDGLADDMVRTFAEDAEGNLWIGTNGGLSRLRAGQLRTFTTREGLPGDAVYALRASPRGTVWIGTEHGLAAFRNGRLEVPPEAKALTGTLLALHEDEDGTLWIGTDARGLGRLREGRLRLYGSADGLPDDTVMHVLDDGRGHLWLSSNKGIVRVARSDVAAEGGAGRPRLQPTVYGVLDGMRSSECNGGQQPAGWRAGDGRLLFATARGVAELRPDRIDANLHPPPVLVEEVLVDGRPAGPDVAPGQRRLEIRYTANSLRVPSRVRFRYRLEGFDAGWIEAGAERKAVYTNLPPGAYAFHVTASNDDGLWSEAGAQLAVVVRPPSIRRPGSPSCAPWSQPASAGSPIEGAYGS